MSKQYRVPDVKKILIKDYEDNDEVNKQLERMGYNIGVRLVEDFLARSQIGRCADFRETAEVISKVGFKMFLGVTPTVANWSSDNKTFSLILDENPLTEFVELPEKHKNLRYSNILCGVLRGALEMVQMRATTEFKKDVLNGDDTTEMRVTLVEVLTDAAPPGED